MLFKGPMVNAILKGTKTQTRRVVKDVDGRNWIRLKGGFGNHVTDKRSLIACPYGMVGDRLWVRENFAYTGNEDGHLVGKKGELVHWAKDAEVLYQSDYYRGDYGLWTRDRPRRLFEGPWRPSIFMPKEVSRILLQITDVRVQRLQDISEADSVAEGVAYDGGWDEAPGGGYQDYSKKEEDFGCLTAKDSYRTLWDSINGKRKGMDWRSNPWVWAITFKRVKR